MAKNTGLKLAGLGVAALLVGFAAGGFTFDDNKQVADLQAQVAELGNQTAEIVEKEVLVDNGNLDLVLEHVYDNEGDITYLTKDLDDDEVELIVDRIVFINDIKAKAVAEVKAEAVDELDNIVFSEGHHGVTFDEDEIERVRVQDDADEVKVSNLDFEDKDADVKVTVKFEQDDVKYVADFNVEFRDGEIDDLELDEDSIKVRE